MKLLVLLLMSLYASSAWSQDFDFTCGFSQMSESDINQAAGTRQAVGTRSSSISVDYRRGQIKTLILFSKFNGAEDPFDLRVLGDREGELNQSADSLLSVTHEGSLAHYFHEMSGGVLTLVPGSGGVNLTRYEATGDSLNDYIGANCANPHPRTGLHTFVTEVLVNADSDDSINFSDANVIAVVTPREFAECTGPTVFNNIQVNNNVTVPRVITAIEVQSFPLIVGVLAHEYGHVMRLPDLYDGTDSDDLPADQGAGIGLWGVMGRGPVGWRRGKIGERHFGSAPTAMSAWSKIEVGWITPETVSADTSGVQIHDINSEDGKVFKISVPRSDTEYFLVENRQNTYSETKDTTMVGSYYDDYAPASGLAIWHVDDNVSVGDQHNANANEFHKRVDLECADGLFSDKGYDLDNPPRVPDSVSGGDNLDYFSFDSTYGNNGNLGDTTDVWNGPTGKILTDTMFTPYTNPSTAGYEGNSQSKFTGIALRDIRSSSPGVMQMDIYLQYWSGPITEDTRWSGRITVGGDVTIPTGTTLTIARGTQILFLADTDDIGGNNDTARSELIVEGELIVEAASEVSAGGVTFRSDNTVDPSTTVEPSNDDWYGIRVRAGGTATLSDVTIQDGSRCVQTEGGTLTMTNVTLSNCGATVTLAPTPPSVRQQITATLTDPFVDMITKEQKQWQWQRRRRSTDAWTNLTSATTAAYRPTTEDIGSQLRATVRYQAETGVYPHAQSAATDPVQVGVPGAPRNLTAAAGDESATLTWEAPANDGGTAITDYKYRYSSDGGTTWIPPQDEDEDPEGTSWGLTPPPPLPRRVGSLTNGRTYVFEVWAVNAAGEGTGRDSGGDAQRRADDHGTGKLLF